MNLKVPDYYQQHIIPADELKSRVKRFQQILKAQVLDGALISHKSGLYYLAGTIQPVQFYVPAIGEPLLLVRRHPDFYQIVVWVRIM